MSKKINSDAIFNDGLIIPDGNINPSDIINESFNVQKDIFIDEDDDDKRTRKANRLGAERYLEKKKGGR